MLSKQNMACALASEDDSEFSVINVDELMPTALELCRRHEEIIVRRNELLNLQYKLRELKRARKNEEIPYEKAKERNQALLQDIQSFQEKMSYQKNVQNATPSKWSTLSTNYWLMVKNVYPVWQEECEDFRKDSKFKK